ncbi:MAG: hypothetical protein AB1742_14885 [bacterium]
MNAGCVIEAVPELDGCVVEWLEPGTVLFSSRNLIFRSGGVLGRREFAGALPSPLWKAALSRARLPQRLLRFMAYNALPLPDGGIFVTFGRSVGTIAGGRWRELEGLERPCRVLRGACAVTAAGSVYFGEYTANPERSPVRVYEYAPGSGTARVVYTFAAGEARHVHGIYADPFTGALWCATGDLPRECGISRTYDGFQTVENVGGGDESWRTVSVQFTRDAVFYATDAEFSGNFIYRLDRRTGRRTELGRINGPVYYSRAVGDHILFCVSAELCPSQTGVSSTLWLVTPSGEVTRVRSFRKDVFASRLFVKLFMPGLFNFPAGPGAGNETYLHGVALRGVDNRTLRLKIGDTSE